MTAPNPFEQSVQLAMPFVDQAFDLALISTEIAEWMNTSGEPALYFSFEQNPSISAFPVGITFFSMNPKTRHSIEVRHIEMKRPNYDKEKDGFKGNHLIVAISSCLKDAIKQKTRWPVEIFTGTQKWREFCAGPEYFALLEQRVLENVAPPIDSNNGSGSSGTGRSKRRL